MFLHSFGDETMVDKGFCFILINLFRFFFFFFFWIGNVSYSSKQFIYQHWITLHDNRRKKQSKSVFWDYRGENYKMWGYHSLCYPWKTVILINLILWQCMCIAVAKWAQTMIFQMQISWQFHKTPFYNQVYPN